MNSLNEQYEEKVRPCIDLIDSLRSLGVEKDLALPAIAVIGDQSSGKSSVLEALSGVALPRGSGIVTRCPLELKMKKITKDQKWNGKIHYRDFTEEIKDPASVEEKIIQAQDKMAGVGVGISKELISLEIASPSVPDLTLIDLPGITRVAVKGQPADIGEQIKRLIWEFIGKRETINLVVVPCNVDIATTEALKMAQEVDPEGERTLGKRKNSTEGSDFVRYHSMFVRVHQPLFFLLGILTKPDLVDKGTEENVVDIINNKAIPLKKGYMIVKCRGQNEITKKVSLTTALEKEKTFFQKHSHFQSLYYDGRASVPKLAEKLTLELVHHIQKSLPRLEEQVETKLKQTQSKLDNLGCGPPSEPSEKLGFLIDRVTSFTQDAVYLSKGEDLRCGYRSKIFSVLRQRFSSWNHLIEDSGTTFSWNIEKEVTQYERKYRGKELPGFINYKTFEAMVQEQVKQLEEPAILKLKEVSETAKKEFFALIQRSLVGLPNLMRAAKLKTEAIMNEKEGLAESMLRTQFKMEMIVYTQDCRYSKKLGKRKSEGSLVNITNGIGASLKEMAKHLKSYYQIAGQRLADQVPLVIHYQMLQEFAVQLQREMLQMLQDKEKMELLLQEDHTIKENRVHLHNCIKRLSKARMLLSDFSMSIYDFNPMQF
ncbi:Interferon-induced GTP-binding protein Mx [Oryzias melastigma]|uniref:Interferon-induced GTP-binding protein Mx n=1 Tax=Oryzias melastigma TaxID=30732 RepID=A0A834CNJ4_ORYME|nr:Interferon-induced GTP-binding protein Mx [Oryzias melastigma]